MLNPCGCSVPVVFHHLPPASELQNICISWPVENGFMIVLMASTSLQMFIFYSCILSSFSDFLHITIYLYLNSKIIYSCIYLFIYVLPHADL